MGYLDEPDHGLATVNFGHQWKLKEESKLGYFNLSTYNNYRWHLSSGDQETFESTIVPSFTFKSQSVVQFSLYDFKIDSLSYQWFLDDKNAIAHGTYKMLWGWVDLT